MKVFITGPTGAIGTALVDHLIAANYEVVAICRENSKRLNAIPTNKNVRAIECNLNAIKDLPLNELGTGIYFFHLAWAGTSGEDRNNLELQLENVLYTLDCIRLAKKLKCKKFIGIGSQAEYGIVNKNLSMDTLTDPITGYGAGKLAALHFGRLEAQNIGIDFNWIRILSVYGPCDGSHTLIMSLIDKMTKGENIELTEGIQEWDYLYSKDAAKALLLIAEHGVNSKVYVLGSGEVRPLKYYIETIKNLIPSSSLLRWGNIPYTSRSVMYLGADLTELKKDTGFEPETSFADGIKETYCWYKEQNR